MQYYKRIQVTLVIDLINSEKNMEEVKTLSCIQNCENAQNLYHGHTLWNRFVECLTYCAVIYIISGILILCLNPSLILQLSVVDCLFGWLYVVFGMFLKLPIITIIMSVITFFLFIAYLIKSERLFLYLFGLFYCYFSPFSFLLILSIY